MSYQMIRDALLISFISIRPSDDNNGVYLQQSMKLGRSCLRRRRRP